MTDEDAYDLCPPVLRKALQESVTEWSSVWALRHFQAFGLTAAIKALRSGDQQFMLAGLIPARGRDKTLPVVMSTYVAAQVSPLRLYDIEPEDVAKG